MYAKGASLNSVEGKSGFSSLQKGIFLIRNFLRNFLKACVKGNEVAIKFLIEHGAFATFKNK